MSSSLQKIIDAYDLSQVKEAYQGRIEITDLQEELGTEGHVYVVRGDKAYCDIIDDESLCNPKFWLYENLLRLPEIQQQLQSHPTKKLFDGTGFSGLEALAWHSKNINRQAVVVMASEFIPDPEIYKYDLEIIHGDLPVEQGYVEKQREVLATREDIIPLHQALYGAKSLAPVGNRVAELLDSIDASFWCIASGANLYGVGAKLPGKTYVVEPSNTITIPRNLDLGDIDEVKNFAKRSLRNYTMDSWITSGKKHSGTWPLHARHVNMYLLRLWAGTGDTGFDGHFTVSSEEISSIQRDIARLNPDYNWTKTTALTMKPAIEMAKDGKNVLIMAYGKFRQHRYRDINVE